MRKQLIIILLVICFVSGLLLSIHNTPAIVNPVFDISQLDFSQDFKLSTSNIKEFIKGRNTFTVTTQQTILYDADTERISSYKAIFYNDQKIIITEICSENQLYITMNGIPFKSNIATTEYCAKIFTPNDDFISVEISKEPVEIAAPKNCGSYAYIDAPEALYALEIACCYLIQANSFIAEFTENIYIQATGDRKLQTIYTKAGGEKDWCATTKITELLQNDIRINHINEFSKTEHYRDGRYTIQTGSSQISSEFSLTEAEMCKHLQNRLISTLILPKYIIGTTSEEDNNTVRYTFIPSEDFATHLSGSACENLYQNPNLLKEIADDFTVTSLYSYMIIEKETGLPLDSGIIFNGEYVISNIPYVIEYHTTQTYQFDTNKNSR